MLKQMLGYQTNENNNTKQSLNTVAINDLSNFVKRKSKEDAKDSGSEQQKKPKLE